MRLHVHKHSWRHRFGDTVFDPHICPGQLSQQLVEARPKSIVDLKVSRAFAIETTRNQEHFFLYRNAVSRVDLLQCHAIPHRCVLTCSTLRFQHFCISHGWTLGQSWELISWKMLRLHVHTHCWRHRFGDTALERHICPGQLSQQLLEARPDSTVDLKASRIVAIENARNQELSLLWKCGFYS